MASRGKAIKNVRGQFLAQLQDFVGPRKDISLIDELSQINEKIKLLSHALGCLQKVADKPVPESHTQLTPIEEVLFDGAVYSDYVPTLNQWLWYVCSPICKPTPDDEQAIQVCDVYGNEVCVPAFVKEIDLTQTAYATYEAISKAASDKDEFVYYAVCDSGTDGALSPGQVAKWVEGDERGFKGGLLTNVMTSYPDEVWQFLKDPLMDMDPSHVLKIQCEKSDEVARHSGAMANGVMVWPPMTVFVIVEVGTLQAGGKEVALLTVKPSYKLEAHSADIVPSLALWDSAREGDTEVVSQWLLSHGNANLEYEHPRLQCTLLHLVCECGHLDLVKLLVQHCAYINAVQTNGSAPLHSAVSGGHQEVVEFLLASGANPNLKDANGQTPTLPQAKATGPEVVASGAITKRGGKFPHSWKLRHVVLLGDGNVSYYVNEAAQSGSSKGEFTLGKDWKVSLGFKATDHDKHGFLFTVAPEVATERAWVFAAVDDASRKCWMDAFNKVVTSLTGAGVTAPVGGSKMVGEPQYLMYGNRSDFVSGIEALVGTSNMTMEEEFGRNIEWQDYNYVKGPCYSKNEWSKMIEQMPVIREKAAKYLGSINMQLTEEEIQSIYLYSGPSYNPLNRFLRCVQGDASLKQQESTWATTILHLNAAIRKLSKVQSAGLHTYRGVVGRELQRVFFIPDDRGFTGCTEYGFMSTAVDAEVAHSYMRKMSGRQVMFMIQCKPEDASGYHVGADISWISQYPEETEILFPPLTVMEVVQKRHQGNVTTVTVVPTYI